MKLRGAVWVGDQVLSFVVPAVDDGSMSACATRQVIWYRFPQSDGFCSAYPIQGAVRECGEYRTPCQEFIDKLARDEGRNSELSAEFKEFDVGVEVFVDSFLIQSSQGAGFPRKLHALNCSFRVKRCPGEVE